MRLLRLAEVPVTDRDTVYRASPARALTFALLGAATGGALLWAGWYAHSWLPAYIAGVIFLFLLLFRRLVTARFRPSNWLVRLADQGAYVQFRSHLNFHFPAGDQTVVFLPYNEIRAARLVRERRSIPTRDAGDRSGSVTEQRRRLVELDQAADTKELAQALHDEVARKAPPGSARWGHYPVRLTSDTTLQVEWRVVPGPRLFLEALSRYTVIDAPRKDVLDFTRLDQKGRVEQEKRLLELVETGDTMAAIKIARELYDYDLAEAKALVEGLRGKASRE